MKQQQKQIKKPAAKTAPHKSLHETLKIKQLLPYLLGILGLTFICFIPVFKNELVFWDDPEYILTNPYILEINLSKIFGVFYFGNYHPLTMLSYELEYHFFGFNAKIYHLDNLLLHLCNVALVFFFIYHLMLLMRTKMATSKALGMGLLIVPTITALLFAIHPMHVESVAWASERKDVLYTFFFLLGLIGYIFYLRDAFSMKYLALSFLFFLLSCFSKGQAVVLPVVFLCMDYLLKRKINARLILEKIPFLLVSILFGILALKAQIKEAAINSDYLTGGKMIFMASYGLTMYLIKLILPINLSGAHPYPGVETGGISPFIYASPFVLLILVYFIYRSTKKNRYVLFGTLFFMTCILMVLKLVPLGDTIISERYTYLPYIGLFFIFGIFFNALLEKFSQYKTILLAGFGVIVVFFSFSTFQRCYAWKDTNTFWTDVAEKYPNYWRAHNNIAQGYRQKGQYEEAVKYFTKAIEMDKECPPVPYMWRGNIYLEQLKRNDLAIADFKKVLDFPNKNDPSQIEARQNLGLAYYRDNQFDESIQYYNEALQREPNSAKTYQLMALVYGAKKDYQAALDAYGKALQLNPDKELMIETLINRGSLYTDVLGKFSEAMEDFKKVLELSPENMDASINIGITYYKKGEFDNAINIFNNTLRKDVKNSKVLYLRSLCFAEKKDFGNAVKDLTNARGLGLQIDENILKMYESKLKN